MGVSDIGFFNYSTFCSMFIRDELVAIDEMSFQAVLFWLVAYGHS